MKVDLEAGEVVEGCPMCASEASLHSSLGGVIVAAQFWVKCENSQCGLTQTSSPSRTDALARWNRRRG